jgi:hypothetical protein
MSTSTSAGCIEILALDLATVTGWARGAPGDIPRCGTVRFASGEGASNNAIFANALTWCSTFLKQEPRPVSIILEAMLPPQAMKGETNRKTRDLLAGLHGIVRAVAHCRGIYEISDVSVLAVRRHFCGDQQAKKHDVIERCQLFGWDVGNHNAADAAACWHFACSLVRPELAMQCSPLFYGKRPMRVSA